MRFKLLIISVLYFFSNRLYTQNTTDTAIVMRQFVKEAKIIPSSYKVQAIDSFQIVQANNMSDLLNNNSTIFIKSYGVSGLASVSFRGTGASHTNVNWNGIRINSSLNGQIDFSLFPTYFIDDADVNYGLSGVINGYSGLGGEISLNNKDKITSNYLNVNQQLASFNNYTTGIKVGLVKNNWHSKTTLYYKTGENNFEYFNITKPDKPKEYLQNSAINTLGVQQLLYKYFNKYLSVGFNTFLLNSNRDLPTALNTKQTDQNQKDFTSKSVIELNGRSKNSSWFYNVKMALLVDELLYEDKDLKVFSQSESYSYGLKITSKHYFTNNTKFLSQLNTFKEVALVDSYLSKQERVNTTFMLGGESQLKKVNINIANRLVSVGNIVRPFLPTIGLRYQLLKSKMLFLKMSAGINYNFPTFNDLYWNPGGNKDLQPELAQMYELGLVLNTKNKKFNTEVTYFNSLVDDWIIWLPSQGYWTPNNVKKVNNYGVETNLSYKFKLNNLIIKQVLSGAYTIAKNIEGYNDNDLSVQKQLIYVPLEKGNYNLFFLYKNVWFNYQYVYTGLRYITTDNNWYLPANFISNFGVGYKYYVNKNVFNLSFKINNLFNQEYQSVANRPMPLRNYGLTISTTIR